MLNYWWVTRPKRKLDSVPFEFHGKSQPNSGCERVGGVDYAPGRIAPKTGREDGNEL